FLFSSPRWQTCPMKRALLVSATLALAAPSQAQDAPEPPTPASIVAAAPAEDWRAIDPADLMVMTLAPDRDGNPREVVIQLMPPPFSQGWVENIRTLARAHWWDGTTVYRVVDNWVAQWGDGEDDEAKAKPLPEGLRVVPESEYVLGQHPESNYCGHHVCPPNASVKVSQRRTFEPYGVGAFSLGWPIALQGDQAWPTHCYASVGVARDLSPDTGTGAELYAVIGH